LSQDKQFYSTFFAIMAGLFVLMIVLIIIAGNLTSEVTEYAPDDVVAGNLEPVGHVNVAGESSSEPAPAPAGEAMAAVEPKSGDQVYNGSCAACHATGAAGAPKVGAAADWADRKTKGIDGLLATAISGLNAMPPRGLCMACSDDELRAAIEYMVDNSR
jgi:cytochrome c5